MALVAGWMCSGLSICIEGPTSNNNLTAWRCLNRQGLRQSRSLSAEMTLDLAVAVACVSGDIGLSANEVVSKVSIKLDGLSVECRRRMLQWALQSRTVLELQQAYLLFIK